MRPTQIRDLRKRLGLTREQFAARLNVAYHTVCQWEQGKGKRGPDRRNAAALDALAAEAKGGRKA